VLLGRERRQQRQAGGWSACREMLPCSRQNVVHGVKPPSSTFLSLPQVVWQAGVGPVLRRLLCCLQNFVLPCLVLFLLIDWLSLPQVIQQCYRTLHSLHGRCLYGRQPFSTCCHTCLCSLQLLHRLLQISKSY
jgi:hypothetical protein